MILLLVRIARHACIIMQMSKCMIILLTWLAVFHCVEGWSAAKQNSRGPEAPTSPQAPGCVDCYQRLAGNAENITTLNSSSFACRELNRMESEFLGPQFTIPKRFWRSNQIIQVDENTAHGFELEFSHCLGRGLPQRMKVPSSALQT